MSQQDKDERRELMSELLGFIASDLDSQSEEKLRQLKSAIRGKPQVTPITFVAPNKSVLVHLHPQATREDAVSALAQLSQWLDANWEAVAREQPAEPAEWPSSPGAGADSPN